MSCSDILLSFLSDVGEDWTDSFIFPDTEMSHIDVDDYLNKSDYALNTNTAANAEPVAVPAVPDSMFLHSDGSISVQQSYSEDQDFHDALDMLDFVGVGDDFSAGLSTDEMFAECAPSSAAIAAAAANASLIPSSLLQCIDGTSSSGKGKRKLDSVSTANNVSNSSYPPKKTKISVNEQISSVCGLLRQYRVHKSQEEAKAKLLAQRRFRYANPIGTAESYLQALFSSTPSSPQDLLKLSSSTATFSCKALSSLVAQSQSKKAMMKLAAWMPVNSQSAQQFPESHCGIGQIAAASRAFVAGMSDIVSQALLAKLKFHVHIIRDSAITSKFGDRLSASFVWRSEGMVAMGYPEELEFNGLIRCTFVKEGVSTANVSFDACKIIRQQAMFKPNQSLAHSLI